MAFPDREAAARQVRFASSRPLRGGIKIPRRGTLEEKAEF